MREAQRNGMSGREQGSLVKSARYLLLLAALSVCAGCATLLQPKVEAPKPSPVSATEPTSPLPAGPSVEHFREGREGFQITHLPPKGGELEEQFNRASSLIKEAKYEKAVELLENVIKQSPELAAPRINAAIAYRRIDKPEQAEQHLKKALESVPGHPVASNEYGLLLRKAGRFAEARAVYEKSLASFPEYHPIHRNLAILCDLYIRDLACASEHYEAYAKAMPGDKQVKLWLADVTTRSGQNLTAAAGGVGKSLPISGQ